MRTNDPVLAYVETWISRNVHSILGLSEAADLTREVQRLKTTLIAAAGPDGFTADQLDRATGDLDDYLTDAYEKVHDPELGFKD